MKQEIEKELNNIIETQRIDIKIIQGTLNEVLKKYFDANFRDNKNSKCELDRLILGLYKEYVDSTCPVDDILATKDNLDVFFPDLYVTDSYSTGIEGGTDYEEMLDDEQIEEDSRVQVYKYSHSAYIRIDKKVILEKM